MYVFNDFSYFLILFYLQTKKLDRVGSISQFYATLVGISDIDKDALRS